MANIDTTRAFYVERWDVGGSPMPNTENSILNDLPAMKSIVQPQVMPFPEVTKKDTDGLTPALPLASVPTKLPPGSSKTPALYQSISANVNQVASFSEVKHVEAQQSSATHAVSEASKSVSHYVEPLANLSAWLKEVQHGIANIPPMPIMRYETQLSARMLEVGMQPLMLPPPVTKQTVQTSTVTTVTQSTAQTMMPCCGILQATGEPLKPSPH